MKESENPPSDFVPLSPESMELYRQFCAKVEPATTTTPPMDFLMLKEDALKWGERLKLEAGILTKFRQRISAAQRDREVFEVMREFLQFASVPSEMTTAGAGDTNGPGSTTRRKGRRSMTLSMSTRAIELVDQGLSNRAIAAQLGVSEPTLRRNIAVKRARAALKGRRNEFPSGHKSKDGQIEAYSDEDDEDDRKGHGHR